LVVMQFDAGNFSWRLLCLPILITVCPNNGHFTWRHFTWSLWTSQAYSQNK
jgi:hypothetical protein